jgi:hypothetical protein
MIEDEESIQYALMEVINALMRNTIDVQRAGLIIRALHIAVKNATRVKFGIHEPVTKIPEYAAPTQEHEVIAQESELPAVSAIPYKPVDPGDRHFWEYQTEGLRILAREAQARKAAEQAHVRTAANASPAQAKPSTSVGTDALVRPGREATVPAAAGGTNASVACPAAIPPHDFKTPQPPQQPNASPESQSASSHRKPPENVKPAPPERKTTNHHASRG